MAGNGKIRRKSLAIMESLESIGMELFGKSRININIFNKLVQKFRISKEKENSSSTRIPN